MKRIWDTYSCAILAPVLCPNRSCGLFIIYMF